MRLFFRSGIAAGLIVYATVLHAVDPAPSSVPTSALPTSVPTAPPPAAAAVPQPITAELNDGSKVEIDADGTVWVLAADGGKTVAPDGLLTLRDGTPFVVREGRRVPGDD